MLKCFATTSGGLSELLREELMALGAKNVKAQPRGVTFEGTQELAYRACLWSRLANRIFVTVLEVELENQEQLTTEVAEINWTEHMNVHDGFAVSFSGKGMGIDHSHYGALKIKDGIVDYFMDKMDQRPEVDTINPDLRIHGHLNRNELTLSIDLVGYSLHQRGYREGQQVKAPLKENLAAALLIRSGWPAIAKEGGSLYDPMCGSGTFLIEAAMMAADIAPGLDKQDVMLLNRWKKHDNETWHRVVNEARSRKVAGMQKLPSINGSDASHKSLDIAEEAILNAGLDKQIEVKQMTVEQGRAWGNWQSGLVITNPPYGERLGEVDEVKIIYTALGNYIKSEFDGWQAAVFTANPELGMYLGIKAKRSHKFANGPMECKLFRFDVTEEYHREPAIKGGSELAEGVQNAYPDLSETEGAIMFANRLKKNLKPLRKWSKKYNVNAYRVYDADMPEYSLSIDYYRTEDAGEWLIVNEYAAPKTVDKGRAKKRLYEALSVLPSVFEIPVDQIVFKVREKQKGSSQYEKLEENKDFCTLVENGVKLRVNFTDYLDTGIFLDHRDVRALVAEKSRRKSMLNLFCYTATLTAQAATLGAASSLSIDMSNTYLSWARENLINNDCDESLHILKQADVLDWLEKESENPTQGFDVIFLDPPSFSTSKRMDGTLDIQRDHVTLIQQAMKLLNPGGELIFSNNLRKFKLDEAALEGCVAENITRKTMPRDFERNTKIHQAWVITKA
ncbi:MAG: 23S rRNA (guanine2069-N7)-methyltransferase/23S rRNA (guanine2445-N2)-methyltransferase [Thiomicrorhabdus sp.]|nr:MAG: 23S rRNA (guanine2069-N7)-methyltransferase/23S rRNA (guanine2445-N2)-methyltransferase [Thiomicrorhabdus sp.]